MLTSYTPLVLGAAALIWAASTVILARSQRRLALYPGYALISAILVVVIALATAPTGSPRAPEQWTDLVFGGTIDDEAEYTVLMGLPLPQQGIYVVLQGPDIPEPTLYIFPWSGSIAQALQDALKEGEENGTGVQMRLPFEPSLDNREPKFYALPQPKMPDKPVENLTPLERALRNGEGQGA